MQNYEGRASYEDALEAAGVTELPDDRSAARRALPAEIAGGRWEDNNPPVVSR